MKVRKILRKKNKGLVSKHQADAVAEKAEVPFSLAGLVGGLGPVDYGEEEIPADVDPAAAHVDAEDKADAETLTHIVPDEDAHEEHQEDILATTKPLSLKQRAWKVVPFHNGKKPVIPMRRTLYFSLDPYGFTDKRPLAKPELVKAGIIPVQDEKGYIYIVREAVDENGNPAKDAEGKPILRNWPPTVAFPEVPAAKLGRARSWPSVPVIRQGEASFWQKALGWGIILIGVVVIIVIFFLIYFLFVS